MTIKNTALTRRGLRRALGTLEGLVAELGSPEGRQQHSMSKPEVDELKQAVAWIRQESEEPAKPKAA